MLSDEAQLSAAAHDSSAAAESMWLRGARATSAQKGTVENKTKQIKQNSTNRNKTQHTNSQPAFKHVFNIAKCS
jgi:hypothetical protein